MNKLFPDELHLVRVREEIVQRIKLTSGYR
jgi:hypothetical protein